VIRRACLAAALLLAGCGSRGEPPESGVLAGAAATPVPTPGSPTGTPAPGYARLRDDAGGWSVDVPQAWRHRTGPQHGFEARSFDPDVPDAQNRSIAYLPPDGAIYVGMNMRQNPDRLEAATFVARFELGRIDQQIREHASVRVAGQPAELYSFWRSQPTDFAKNEPTLWWYLRSPFFDDRMVVISAFPAASPLRPEVERIVASLQFYQPAPVPLTPLVSRADALAQISARPGHVLSRIEARLVLYKEFEAAVGDRRAFGIDPDTLVWVVAYAGQIPSNRHGFGDSSPCTWAVSVLAARPPDAVGSFMCANASWPAWFDSLEDRAR
jgi:hypothetical protein